MARGARMEKTKSPGTSDRQPISVSRLSEPVKLESISTMEKLQLYQFSQSPFRMPSGENDPTQPLCAQPEVPIRILGDVMPATWCK